jgi:hypothetical protein
MLCCDKEDSTITFVINGIRKKDLRDISELDLRIVLYPLNNKPRNNIYTERIEQ